MDLEYLHGDLTFTNKHWFNEISHKQTLIQWNIILLKMTHCQEGQINPSHYTKKVVWRFSARRAESVSLFSSHWIIKLFLLTIWEKKTCLCFLVFKHKYSMKHNETIGTRSLFSRLIFIWTTYPPLSMLLLL